MCWKSEATAPPLNVASSKAGECQIRAIGVASVIVVLSKRLSPGNVMVEGSEKEVKAASSKPP